MTIDLDAGRRRIGRKLGHLAQEADRKPSESEEQNNPFPPPQSVRGLLNCHTQIPVGGIQMRRLRQSLAIVPVRPGDGSLRQAARCRQGGLRHVEVQVSSASFKSSARRIVG